MTLSVALLILITHWVADFVLQTEEQAINKSKSNYHLFKHVSTYSMAWLMVTTMYCAGTESSAKNAILFYVITFVSHFITDWATSRMNKHLMPHRVEMDSEKQYDYEEKEYVNKGYYYPDGENYHNFFVGIGFDQLLHYAQLFLTFNYLFFR